jgi:hypothetical protein
MKGYVQRLRNWDTLDCLGIGAGVAVLVIAAVAERGLSMWVLGAITVVTGAADLWYRRRKSRRATEPSGGQA